MKLKNLLLESNKESNKQLLPYITELTKYFQENGMKCKPYPKVKFTLDEDNAKKFFGKTAYYDPNEKSITLYTLGRHPKDILRSYSHELVHHHQNLENRIHNVGTTNVNEDDKLQELEKEAYLKGNMIFREWEDKIKNK